MSRGTHSLRDVPTLRLERVRDRILDACQGASGVRHELTVAARFVRASPIKTQLQEQAKLASKIAQKLSELVDELDRLTGERPR